MTLVQKSVHTQRYGSFLDRIIEARHSAGLTQQELADKLRRPQSYVSKYERGERRLDVLEFVDIAAAIGVDPHLLLDELRPRGRGR